MWVAPWRRSPLVLRPNQPPPLYYHEQTVLWINSALVAPADHMLGTQRANTLPLHEGPRPHALALIIVSRLLSFTPTPTRTHK